MKDPKYTTIFSSVIRPMVSEEKDEYLALASAIDVARFVPNVDTDKNIDLLPIAFNACVVNRVNLNGDVVDTKAALDMCSSFINKPINIEHNRQRVVGTILTAGFSEFGTDKPLLKEEIEAGTYPFNITLGGVVWKVVNNDLTDLIEESNDPTSEHYLKISASWELGFTDYELVLMDEESKNLSAGVAVSDESEIEKLKENLRIFGGTGKTEDGRCVYRKVINDVVPLGIGLTETPAAEVKGVFVKQEIESRETESEEKAVSAENEENNISQSKEKNVNKTERVIMKITSIKDITDENLKELSASAISDFIEEELKEASEKYIAEKQKIEKSLDATKEEFSTLREDSDKTKDELKQVKEALEGLEAEKVEREAEEAFNLHMATLDEEYELSDEDREVIATDIKDMNEAAFEDYRKKVSVLLRDKNKKVIEAAQAAVEEKTESAEETAKADATEKVEESKEAEETVDEVLDSAETEATEVPVSTTAEEPSVYDKYKKAFSVENWIN